jgi:hypothetical protein
MVMTLSREDLERLCSPSYLDGLESGTIAELRTRRDECQGAEAVVSYLRRVIQGGIDLVEAEVAIREGSGGSDIGRLVERLPSILAPQSPPTRVPAHTSLHTIDAVASELDPHTELALEELLAAIVGAEDSALMKGLLPGANVCSYSADELAATLERLRAEEAKLSHQRRELHERIDRLQAAVVERYKSGSADADSLLH